MSKRILPLWIYISLITVALVAASFSMRPVWAAGASISGTVTDEASQPVATISVTLVRDMSALYGYELWEYRNSTTTDGDGIYSFAELEAGTYRIEFRDNNLPAMFATTYYNQAPNGDLATDIVVNEDATVTDIDTQLQQRGALGGRVSNTAGNPITNISVGLDREQINYDGTSNWYNMITVYADANGYYKAEALDPGNYRLSFQPYSSPPFYISEFYDDAASYETATSVMVTAGELITGINAALATPGVITGFVSDGTGEPLANIYTSLYRKINVPNQPFWQNVQSVYTDAAGRYTLLGVETGTYRVGFSDSNSPPVHAPEFYDNVPSLEEATNISVTNGMTVTNINAQLEDPAQLRGRVTAVTGEPLAMIAVTLYEMQPSNDYWREYGYTQTDGDGYYEFEGLNGGDYRIGFSQTSYPIIYQPEYYENASSLETATTFTVPRGEIVDHIDAQLETYGQITGQVTDVEKMPLAQIMVIPLQYFVEGNYWNQLPIVRTDASGHYTVTSLSTGSYAIDFQTDCCPHRYLRELYENAPNVNEATKIPVQLGQTVSGINAQLSRYGDISGQVNGKEGSGLFGVTVDVLHQIDNPGGPIWVSAQSTETGGDGAYHLYDLPADNYRVRFNYGRVNGYVPAYWQDTLDFERATTLSVTLNSSITNIDAQLTKGGSIGGTARTVDGRTYYIRIVLYEYRFDATGEDPWYPLRTLYYDGNSYLFDGLDAGVYRIGFFDDQDPGYHKEFYPDQPYVETAQSFTIALGQQITDIDAILEWPGETDFPPHANDDVITLFEGSRASRLDTFDISLLQNDKDDWEYFTVPLTATLVSPPQHGHATVAADGQFSYQHDGSDSTTDSFSYQAHDAIQASNVATVTVNIIPVNEKPYAIADRIVVMRGASTSILESGSDSLTANDLDPEGDALTVTVATGPQHGALLLDSSGIFTYTHDGGSTDNDRFTYRASDGHYTSDPATVTVLVKPAARFAFTKTVGIEGIEPACTPATEIRAPRDTTMVYCYTVTNTGEVPLLYHSLSDSHLGMLLTDAPYLLLPGGSYSVQFTQTLMISTTNVATWTASTGPTATARAQRNPLVSAGSRTAATVIISSATDDLDDDTIPDNVEGGGDPDHDNIPNFRDTDSDNDGMADRDEVGPNPATPLDSNNNGIVDYLESERRLYLPIIAK